MIRIAKKVPQTGGPGDNSEMAKRGTHIIFAKPFRTSAPNFIWTRATMEPVAAALAQLSKHVRDGQATP